MCSYGTMLIIATKELIEGFGDLGRDVYFRGAGEQAHSFEDLGSPAKK